jgi:hypothetical protein
MNNNWLDLRQRNLAMALVSNPKKASYPASGFANRIGWAIVLLYS